MGVRVGRRVYARLTVEQKEFLRQLARRRGVTMSDVLRSFIDEAYLKFFRDERYRVTGSSLDAHEGAP